VACCLLGLRFEKDQEYWTEVKRVLDDMVAGIRTTVDDLQVAEREAKLVSNVKPAYTTLPPWMTGSSFPSTRSDFAPRTSDHALLLQQIESMETTLQRAWTNLQAIRPSIDSSENLTSPWVGVRGDLGELIRDWERGKDIVSRLDANTLPNTGSSEEGEEADLEPMPTFLRAWEEDLEPSSIATDSVRSTSDDTHGTFSSDHHDIQQLDPHAAEVLPPPGQDMVFESIPMPVVPRGKAKLSREERIRLMKEARDRPLEISAQDKGVAEMGGDVVGELKSMIGIIRRRKGIPEAEPSVNRPPLQEVTTRDERRLLPIGLADDLKKAFVFPPPHVDNQDSH
jgi:hypothetical protein